MSWPFWKKYDSYRAFYLSTTRTRIGQGNYKFKSLANKKGRNYLNEHLASRAIELLREPSIFGPAIIIFFIQHFFSFLAYLIQYRVFRAVLYSAILTLLVNLSFYSLFVFFICFSFFGSISASLGKKLDAGSFIAMIFAATFLITLVTIKLMKVFLNKSEKGPGAIEGVILGIMYNVLFLPEVFWFLFMVNPKM